MVPAPGSLLQRMVPPWLSTIALVMDRPSPTPGMDDSRAAAVRKNLPKIWVVSFGDIPMPVECVRSLQPMLDAFGTHPNFRSVIFTMDETVYSRELGPLAGFYPGLFVGVPWWFIDAPDAIKRFRSAVTEYGTFYKTSGFIDDTRAFLSIPARHDMSRRCDVTHLAELVVEHRLEMDEAEEVAQALVSDIPRHVFHVPA